MSSRSRRRFLEDSMLAAAALTISRPGKLFAKEENDSENSSPNDRLSVAVVGVNGRGKSHLGAFSGRKDTEVTYICDADAKVGQARVDEVANRQGRAPRFVQDMREVFDDPNVDIVTTATPNHWHALCSIWAMQAGKDVYVEKPVSHNVSEGRRIVQVARKEKKICQTGTQSRSNAGMREAIAYLHAGKLGEISIARGLCYKRRRSIGGPVTDNTVPDHIDYSLWSGPAQLKPVTRPRFHYDWHWQFDYGNGDLGNQGIHQMDIARWGLGKTDLGKSVIGYGGRYGYKDAGNVANTEVCIHDFGDSKLVFETRGLETDPLQGAGVGNIFYGTEGYLVMTSYHSGAVFTPDGEKVVEFGGGGDHYANFIDAVRSRNHEDLTADILDGHLSSALCHLGNISYRLGESISPSDARARLGTDEENQETFTRFADHLQANGVSLDSEKVGFGAELTLDTANESFVGNDAANAMLTRDYRAPFVVPSENDV